jgi:hypothetical protein
MKDSDIIKALECCAKLTCSECPYYEKRHIRCRELRKLALDLINRQKAEIEELRKEKDNLIKTYKECMTEAIKDFIAEFERRCIEGGIYPAFVKRQLEHVKEEMVGE